jgi:uncharacterized protein YdaU (DUF1376 family)
MAEDMNYYPHHIGDHLIDASHLSILEDGAYRRMKDRYFATETPLTNDETALFRTIGARSEDEKTAAHAVLSEFFTLTELGWTHKRCDEEIAAYQMKSEANKTNGAKGGRPKKDATEPSNNPMGLVSVSDSEPRLTLTKNQEPIITTPIPPTGGLPPKKGISAIALLTYLDSCRTAGTKSIPENDPVFDYIAEVKIPTEFLRLQWHEFKDRYAEPGAKRYKDWPTVFRKSVRGNWFRLWYADEHDSYALTTTGQQAQKFHQGKAA